MILLDAKDVLQIFYILLCATLNLISDSFIDYLLSINLFHLHALEFLHHN